MQLDAKIYASSGAVVGPSLHPKFAIYTRQGLPESIPLMMADKWDYSV